VRATSRRSGALRRPLVALVIAVAALLLAAVAALVPARKLEAHYSWPPQTLPADQPTRTWYAPLLLARHTPASISARLPCAGQPLPDAPRPLVVLATTRDASGLVVTQDGRRLSLKIGGAELVHVDETSAAADCAYAFRLADDGWTLTGGSSFASKDGTAPMPEVDGLFSDLDLRAGPRPAVQITTSVYATRSTLGQTLARRLAAIAALVALFLLVPLPAAWRRRRLPRPQAVDAVVILLLGLWWVIGPAYFDDGWIMAGEHNFLATGNFSAYYDSFGGSSSLQYWLLWLQHPLFDASNALVVLRLPALLCLVATWLLCRWILGRTIAGPSGVAMWALASMFLVGAFAWGMTLRPEPVVALLILTVVAGTVRFLERGTTAPLAVCGVFVALAVSAHPAGLLSLAPLLVAAPRVLAWARTRVPAAATIVLAAVALATVLAFLGSDVRQFHSDATSLRAHGAESAGWRDELTRYELLARPLYGAPLRRAWVALAFLAVLGYILRRRRDDDHDALLDLFSPALGIAFVLLIVTPAKIPWHFGALIGLAALAVAAETARIVAARRAGGWHVRPFIVIGAATAAAAWSWFPRNAWSDLDLRTLSWTLGVEQRVTFAKLAGLVPLVALVAFVLVSRGRRKDDAAWWTATWIAPLLAVPLIVFTVGVLVADAKKTDGWTLTRQNLDSLRNDLRCGVADDAVLPRLATMRALQAVGSQPRSEAVELPQPPVTNAPRFVLGLSQARSPWFRLPASPRVGFFATGSPGAGDSLRIEWGRLGGNGAVRLLGSDGIADPALTDPSPDLVVWRFLPAGSLPARPGVADAVRIVVESTIVPGGSIGITAPLSYEDESLAHRLSRSAPSLALPNLYTYVPCVEQPALQGHVEVPNLIVGQEGTLWPIGTGTSPFDGLPRVYNLVRLPLTDSPDPPGDVAIYEVDRRIPGGVLAPVH
jgi:arabinosyltransferase B